MSDRYKGAILSPTAPTVTPQSAGGIYTSSQQLQYQGQGVWPSAFNNPINNSLRLRASATAYLNRTGGTSTSRRIHTFSFWTKSSVIGGTRTVASAGPDDNNREVIFIDSNKFTYQVKIASTFYDLESTQVFRDPAAWYHFVCAVDTTQATSSNRVKIYVNGVQITAFGTATYPPQNADLFFDDSNGSVSYIGALRGYVGSIGQYDGYMTEFNFVDGQQLAPSSFGTTDAYGIWQPIPYTGTYGTNGFYLKFTDNSALTTSSNVGLGRDFSGNANYWVTNNISITAGSTYDSMIDVPTNTNQNTANYCTLNPLAFFATGASALDGNLTLSITTAGGNIKPTFGATTGKFYAEFTINNIGGATGTQFSIATSSPSTSATQLMNAFYYVNGQTYDYVSASYVSYGASYTTGDIIGVAWDCDAFSVTFYKNNVSQGTLSGSAINANPAGQGVAPISGSSGSPSSISVACNYGQRPFSYTPPTGFLRLNTYNLPTPTILAGNQYMDATTYAGNNGTQSVTNSGSMQPDFVWVKNRTNAYTHLLYDVIRGVGTLKAISSSQTTAEGGMSDNATFGYLSALNSNGFTVVSGSTANSYTNSSSNNYVGWQWRANGAGVSNTNGTITSTVSANTTAGFSIVTYTGTGANATVGHGLGVAPSMMIIKRRNQAEDWSVYHISIGATNKIFLDLTNATSADSTMWNNTTPTSSLFSIGTNTATNANTGTYVAYCFAQVAGYSAFGSYTGNGSSDGPFVFTGFRPRFLIVKRTNDTGSWIMTDSARSTYNVTGELFNANTSGAEFTTSDIKFDYLSNGFKLREVNGAINASGSTYIYMAFAENPFKIARGR